MPPALVEGEIEAAKRKPPDRIAGRVAALHKEIGRFQRDLAKVDGVIPPLRPVLPGRLYSSQGRSPAVKPL